MITHKIVNRAPGALTPHPRNSRKHSEEQIEQVANSIKVFGFTIPVLVDPDDQIVAGHCRVLAATKLKLESVPCIVADDWSEELTRAYIIADNKLTENGGWDQVMLGQELAFLADLEDDLFLDATAFDDEEISAAIQASEGYQPNLNPENAQSKVTQEDIDRVEDGASDKYLKPQVLVPLTCPHCGEDFKVDADHINLGQKP